jgi:3-deoxy-D-manno-octulosonic-acid transferase
LIREVAGGRPVIVAGSTVSDQKGDRGVWEETLVIGWWGCGEARSKFAALLVIAPRHPERFGLVESIVEEYAYARASDWVTQAEGTPSGAMKPRDDRPHNTLPGRRVQLEVVLLDTIGDLAAVYGIADVAFVGGSLVKRGGHNPLEPAQFGVPVVMGPSFENFRDVVGKMKAADAIRIVGGTTEDLSTAAAKSTASGRDDSSVGAGKDDGARLGEELERAFVELLTDRAAAQAMGERGRRVFEEQQGATGRTVAALIELIRNKPKVGVGA